MMSPSCDRLGRRRYGLIVLVVATRFLATEAIAQTREGSFLGLTPGSGAAPEFWEGRTDYRLFLRPKGVVRAIMLFARFPDAETEEKTHDLYDWLVPEGVAYFNRASYGELTLTVDAHHRWVLMDNASTSGRYDGSKWETHKAYIAEVVRKTTTEVDFSKYKIVYIVASKNKGTPKSPTWRAWPGKGIRAGATEIRHAVTFGNDIREYANWGWQTLAHETGHKVSLSLGSGQGPIQVIAARPDDGKAELEKRFVTLYNALYDKGPVIVDPDQRVKIEILAREGRAYRIGVTR